MSGLIKLDGSYGEGGGALLRTALSVSVLTQQSFQIEHIRTGTKYIGLDVEDIALIKTLADLTHADVSEYSLGGQSLLFAPTQSLKPLRAVIPAIRDERKRGPNALVLASTLAPLLARSGGYSDFEIEGETFSNSSMTYDFLAEVVMPVWRKMNLYVSPELHRAAYDRVTEGRSRFEVEPGPLTAIDAMERGEPKLFTAKITTTKGQRSYIDRIISHLNKLARSMRVPFDVEVTDAKGDQSAQFLTLRLQFERGMGGAGCMGSWRVQPEQIAQAAFDKLANWTQSPASFDPITAEQLLVAASFAEGTSQFTVSELTPRFTTMAWVIKQFSPVRIVSKRKDENCFQVTVGR